MKITAVQRPFIATFHASGHQYAWTSEQTQRVLDEYPAIKANTQRVVLPGHNTSNPRERVTIQPATRGGGPAFIISK